MGMATVNRPGNSGDPRVCVGVLLKSACIYNFQGIRCGKWRLRSTTEVPKYFVF